MFQEIRGKCSQRFSGVSCPQAFVNVLTANSEIAIPWYIWDVRIGSSEPQR